MAGALLWPEQGRAETLSVGNVQAVAAATESMPNGAAPPAVAWNGNGWLVAYSDYDPGFGGVLVGVRVDGDGNVVDQPGFEIASAPTDFLHSALASRGGDYAVAWIESPGDGEYVVRHRAVGSEGALGDVLTLGTIDWGVQPYPQLGFASGTDGDLVVWCVQEVAGGVGTCHWAAVTAATTAVGSIELPAGVVGPVQVEASGGDWLVVAGTYASGDGDVFGFRVGADGALLDDVPFEIAATDLNEERPFLAPAADGWALVFTDYDVLRAATVSAAGVVEVSAGELGPALGSGDIYATALEVVADGYVLLGTAYNEGGRVGRHLDQAFAPTAEWVSLSDDGSNGAAAWGAGALLVAFGSAAGDNAPQIQRLDGNVAVLDEEPRTVSFEPIDQRAPLVARGADAWLVLWHETDFKTSNIRWQLLDDAGVPLSTEPTDLFVGAPGYTQAFALAGSGCGWLVVWEDDANRLLATRLDSSGAVLDDEPLELDESGGGNGVDATFDGTHWVIAWVGQDNYNQGEATILRVSTEGEFVDGGPIVVSGDSVVGFAAVQVEADDEGYAVSWQADNGGVFLSRVDRSGTPLAGAPQALLAAGAPVGTQKVDYLGGNGWLVWERNEIEHNLNFKQLASSASSQILGNVAFRGWDLIAMRERALVAMVGDDPSLLSFWLGGSTDPAALVLELILSGAQISSPRLAVQSGLDALVAFESYERTGVVASTRIKTATLTRSPDGAVDPDDTVDLTLGCSPTGEGGSGGDGNGGDSNGNAGEQGAGNGNATGGVGAGGEAAGGLGGDDGAAPSSSDDKDRYSSCGCRTVGQSSNAPWLLLALVAAALVRRSTARR